MLQGRFAKFKQYLGHSAHVTNVRWTADSQWLVTVGGSDSSLLLWKLTVGQPSGSSDQSDTDSEEEGGTDPQNKKSTLYLIDNWHFLRL